MNIEEILNKINVNNLYKTILDLNFFRDPILNYDNLNKAGDYIYDKLIQYGLKCEKQFFKLSLDENEYFNVIGDLNPGKGENLLITSHYDHIKNVIGADDNLSGVAVMLECARVISDSDIDKSMKFVSFTLEENHPGIDKLILESRKKHNLIGDDFIETNFTYFKNRQKFTNTLQGLHIPDGSKIDLFDKTFASIKQDLTENEVSFYKDVRKIYTEIEKISNLEFIGLQGSQHFVKDKKFLLENIHGVINLETCGYTSNEPHSQKLSPGLTFEQFPNYNIKDSTIGDYIIIVSDKNSTPFASSWFSSCKDSRVELPALFVAVPFDFDLIRQNAPDLIRSDHSPFWINDVPAIMITDGANFRNPYYHTPGDTIETLNFEFLEKVTRSTALTALNLNSGK